MIIYYAHSKEGFSQEYWQPLKEHLTNVSAISGEFAKKFNHEKLGITTGLFHDFGKYTCGFQQRFFGGRKVDHATAGALELIERFKYLGEKILAYCTIGHHSGLPDTGNVESSSTFYCRLNKKDKINDYSAYKADWSDEELEAVKPELNLKLFLDETDKKNKKNAFSISFLTRMLFSCLVDADWLDTESFMSGAKSRGNFMPLNDMLEKFNAHIAGFADSTGDINAKRNQILQECIAKAGGSKGFYRLTVPTGGGKTLSSMAFALNHAIANNQDRIIYTIPYTSIIEQNAQVFREIFGGENLLEHHSNYVFEKDDSDEADETSEKLKLASENWDVPVVVATNVQFFESLFANKPSKCRKLHNIANSVIIMDEAQMLPVDYLKPCLRAMEELVTHYNCTIVLCTATQPALDAYIDIKATEIVSNQQELESFFKRVEVEKIGKRSDDELAAELLKQNQVLAIVNTKKHAKALYRRLKGEEGTYHLSTLMCPKHRKKIIAEIKARLAIKPEQTTRVISTQLIEAGVDIDFPCVYRSAAGLDSIIQSAGRCNRNGKFEIGLVKVFETTESYGKPLGYLQRTAQIGADVMNEFDDPICAEAVLKYFARLYDVENTDTKGILGLFTLSNDGNEDFQYKTVAKEFKLIEQNTKCVIIPYGDEAETLIDKLRTAKFPKKYLKLLQPYTVNLYERDYYALKNKGYFEDINGFAEVLLGSDIYDEKEGLKINNESEAVFS